MNSFLRTCPGLVPRHLIVLGTLGLLCAVQSPAYAQKPSLGFEKGDSVALAVPGLLAEVNSGGFLGNVTKFDIVVRGDAGATEVKEPGKKGGWRTDWRAAGFPPARHYEVGKIKVGERDSVDGKWIEVTLKVRSQVDFRIFAPVGQADAIRGVVVPAEKGDSVFRAGYAALSDRYFVGPLSTFSPDERQQILTFAHITAQSSKIGSETYKQRTYLVIALPEDGSTWNDLKVNRGERIGRLIGERLALLKAFAKVAVPHDSIGGLKLEQPSRHGHAPDYLDVKVDHVEAYFPMDQVMKFAEADVTSQALVNASIILVNSDRVEIDLSTQ